MKKKVMQEGLAFLIEGVHDAAHFESLHREVMGCCK